MGRGVGTIGILCKNNHCVKNACALSFVSPSPSLPLFSPLPLPAPAEGLPRQAFRCAQEPPRHQGRPQEVSAESVSPAQPAVTIYSTADTPNLCFLTCPDPHWARASLQSPRQKAHHVALFFTTSISRALHHDKTHWHMSSSVCTVSRARQGCQCGLFGPSFVPYSLYYDATANFSYTCCCGDVFTSAQMCCPSQVLCYLLGTFTVNQLLDL